MLQQQQYQQQQQQQQQQQKQQFKTHLTITYLTWARSFVLVILN